jgi:hypothetical protein
MTRGREQPKTIADKGSYTDQCSDYDEYLNPIHFAGKTEVTLIIREVTADHVYRQKEKREIETPVIWFKETRKGLVLSRTNRLALAQLFGDDAAKCIGQKVRLKLTPMRVAGKDMQVIRVQPAGAGAGNGKPPNVSAPGNGQPEAAAPAGSPDAAENPLAEWEANEA